MIKHRTRSSASERPLINKVGELFYALALYGIRDNIYFMYSKRYPVVTTNSRYALTTILHNCQSIWKTYAGAVWVYMPIGKYHALTRINKKLITEKFISIQNNTQNLSKESHITQEFPPNQ